jgi:cytidine deaminase
MSKSFGQIFMSAVAHEEEFLPFPLLQSAHLRDWSALWQSREHLVIRAQESATRHGHSYRGFHVGAAVLVSCAEPDRLRSMGRSPYMIYTGANWKRGRDKRNTCAEVEIYSQMRQQEHFFPIRKVLALVIAGEAQSEPDTGSGIITPTLHPCHHCRQLLMDIPAFRKDTVIITASPSTDTMEVMSFVQLLELHGLEYPDRYE